VPSADSSVALEFTLDEDDWIDGFLDQVRVVGAPGRPAARRGR
jgi:hypothetical protein